MPNWQDHPDAHLVDKNCHYQGECWGSIDEQANDDIDACAVKLYQLEQQKAEIMAYQGDGGGDTEMEELYERETRQQLQDAIQAKMKAAVLGHRINELWTIKDDKKRKHASERYQDLVDTAIAVARQEVARHDGRTIIDIGIVMEDRFGVNVGDVIKGVRQSGADIKWPE